ncbi:MAG TPA: adenylate/guanylate cyclase domain-containing protein [Salinibacter sp.]|nr:adenylate/guanylate cyclase domain-containing protein [Salinibacter sp.]
MSSKVARRLLAIPLLAVLSLGLTFLLHAVNEQLEEAQNRSPLGGLNSEITDLAFQGRDVTAQDSLWSLSDVVVIDIDDASIQELGRTQLWPRSFTARVIDHVSAGNPAAIGLDILYTESDSLSSHYARLLANEGFDQTEQILGAMSTDDKLARALREAGNTYLALYDDSERPPPNDLSPIQSALRVAHDSSRLAHRLPSLSHPVLPISSLRQAARGIAPIPSVTAADGVVRYYPGARRLPSGASNASESVSFVPTFSVLLAADVLGVPISEMRFTDRTLHLGTQRRIPVTPAGNFRINWLGEKESIRRISYHKVLRQEVPAAFFENKVVFVGGSATGLEDLKTTPVEANKPGVLVHAEAFLNVVNRAYLAEWTIWDLWPWLLVASLPFLSLVLWIQPLYASLATLVFGAFQFFGYLLYLFPKYEVVLPIGTILVWTLLTLLGGVVFKYVTEEWARQQLRDAFASYVSASIVDQVTDNPDVLELGGEKKELTVLFSDIRNFTTYSENLDPREVVAFLNRFFDLMTESVFEQDGTVDKFMGDGMMAIFGAPLQLDDHPTRACAAALSMAKALDALNQEMNVEADVNEAREDPISIGVGINTGEMVAGNIGSSQRFEYTVVGDAVNLAARLEPLNRLLGTRILLSASTYHQVVPSPWTFRELGTFRVKGREDPVELYELLAPNTYAEPEALCKQFEEALSLYRKEHFSDARAAFEECQSLHPDDGPSSFYLNLCAQYQHEPGQFDSVLDVRNGGG